GAGTSGSGGRSSGTDRPSRPRPNGRRDPARRPTGGRRRWAGRSRGVARRELGGVDVAHDEYRLAAMRIRRARPEDARAIAEIHVRSWQAAYAGLLPHEALESLSIADRAERWRGWLEQGLPDHRVWVAEEEDRIVGFTSTGPSRDREPSSGTAEVYTLYLAPDLF